MQYPSSNDAQPGTTAAPLAKVAMIQAVQSSR